MKSGMCLWRRWGQIWVPNPIIHNMIIVAQFLKKQGRGGMTRQIELPQKITSLPDVYTEQELCDFFAVCTREATVMFSTFLLTGFREQEVMHLFWEDINFNLHTIQVTAKPDYSFYPKRWEEREVPVPATL